VTKLLHFSASPRGEASQSLAVAKAFLDGYVEANPEVELEEVDLFDGTLPAFGRLAAEAKMGAYLFSIPMWNSGIPYVLKQWIDIVTQPGWVFGFTPENGYEGLITGKRAATIYVSGVYSPGAPLAFGIDFHSTFFNDWLRFAGFAAEDLTEIRFQPTVLTASLEEDRGAALAAARAACSEF
jgi:FMN-dependent NADH-azoreductase